MGERGFAGHSCNNFGDPPMTHTRMVVTAFNARLRFGCGVVSRALQYVPLYDLGKVGWPRLMDVTRERTQRGQ